MNFYPSDIDPRDPPRQPIRCFATFNNPVCYEHTVLVMLGGILIGVCLSNLIGKLRGKKRLTKKGAVMALLLLQSLTFTLGNFDKALTFLYYATLYFQGLLLSCILYYYALKLLKLLNREHLRSCMLIPLIGLIIAVTTFQVIGVVQKAMEDGDGKQKCKECYFQGLLWFQFSQTALLVVLGIVLSIKLKSKIDQLTVMAVTVPANRVMFKRFWFLAMAEIVSTSFTIFVYFYFLDETSCALFPQSATLSTFADGVNQFMITVLPALFTYLNFRSYRPLLSHIPSRALSEQIMLSSGLYFKSPQ